LIAYLQIQNFYVRTLGYEHSAEPAIVQKDRLVLDMNEAAKRRRVAAEMSASEAKACLVGGVFRNWEPETYIQAQHEWLNRVAEFSDVIEPDEQHSAWVDLSVHPNPIDAFQTMISEIPHARGGLAKSKWISKLAARRGDPDFGAVYEPREFLSRVPLHEMEPIDTVHASRLKFLGYFTCGDAIEIPRTVLARQFGNQAILIWNAIRGISKDHPLPLFPEKTASDRIYFQSPVEQLETIDQALFRLADSLSDKLDKSDSFSLTMGMTIEFEEMPPSTGQRTFTKPLHHRRSVYFAAKRIWEALAPKSPVMGLRITLKELRKKQRHQTSFDSLIKDEKILRAQNALLSVRKSFGDQSIQIAGDIPLVRRRKVLKEWRDATGWV
jgi:DNA polymerase-4